MTFLVLGAAGCAETGTEPETILEVGAGKADADNGLVMPEEQIVHLQLDSTSLTGDVELRLQRADDDNIALVLLTAEAAPDFYDTSHSVQTVDAVLTLSPGAYDVTLENLGPGTFEGQILLTQLSDEQPSDDEQPADD